MLISLEWLKDYVEINEDIKELEHALTMIGQEVEAIEIQGEGLDNIVVGQVIEYKKHPDSEKLSLLKVDVAEDEPLQIICGAPNHKEGDKVAVAKIGAVLPGNFKIKKAKVRGVESYGMLCSETELGIGEESDGIIILSEDAVVGTELREHLNLNDVIFELEITPNRPDCLSHIGIAREIAAYYNREVKYPATNFTAINEKSDYKVKIEDEARCKRYSARVIRDVKVEDSPEWLKRRLKAIGLRPINNVVDITNYLTFEYNQPMHAFDFSKIEGKKVVVREAKTNEKIVTLDGEERELTNKELVIADSNRAIAIAGVMGGANSEVDENTKDILLEVAYFTPENIRKTSKNLTLSSDSSYRFERGMDRELIGTTLDRACNLLEEITSGKVEEHKEDIYLEKPETTEISLDLLKLNKFIGKDLTLDTVEKILLSLGLKVNRESETEIKVIPTSYRQDLKRTADLYEEVIRMYGFENIEDIMPKEEIQSGKVDRAIQITDDSKKILRDLGLQEVINYSFVSRDILKAVKNESETLEIMNPLNEEMVVMRPTLIPSLLTNIKDNFNRNIKDVKFFEVSSTFTPSEELADEVIKVAIAVAGKESKSLWDVKPESYDFYDLKGYVESFMETIGVSRYQLNRTENKAFHPGRAADIMVGRDLLGTFGEVHPDVCESIGISKERVYIAELELEKALKYAKSKIKYQPIVKYPEVTRDLAIVVPTETLVGDMVNAIKKSSNIIESVELFDVYEGEKVEAGKKSVAISIIMRKATGTLEEKEVTTAVDKILSLIKKKFNGEIRQ